MSLKIVFDSEATHHILKFVGFHPAECEQKPVYSGMKRVFAVFVLITAFFMEIIGMIMHATPETMPL